MQDRRREDKLLGRSRARRGSASDILFLPVISFIIIVMTIIIGSFVWYTVHGVDNTLSDTGHLNSDVKPVVRQVVAFTDSILNLGFWLWAGMLAAAVMFALFVRYSSLSLILTIFFFGISVSFNYYLGMALRKIVAAGAGSLAMNNLTVWLANNFIIANLIGMSLILLAMYITPFKGRGTVI